MTDSKDDLERALAALRAELEVPVGFSPEAVAEAERAAARGWRGEGRAEMVDIPFVTVDPPGSRDLDQALHVEPGEGGGWRVRYAIADVGAWVERGGALELEAWRRGVTYYAPDHREPLYPPVLSQDAASLLPDGDRPAVVFTLDVRPDGELAAAAVERAAVRSRAQLTYGQVRDAVLGGGAVREPWGASLRLLREVGVARRAAEQRRGGVSLPIRSQHVEERAAARLGYAVAYEEPNPAEEWNAQLSLLAGHAAAERMVAAGVGILRTSPPAEEREIHGVREVAHALGFVWPDEIDYPAFIHSLPADAPRLDTLVWQARRLMRGADLVAFQGEPPAQPLHSGLAMRYAHCTAPLRRLADRYVLDLLVRLERGERPTAAEVSTLEALPPVMNAAEQRAARLERKAVDLAEAFAMVGREGERFAALVLDADGGRAEVQLVDPPVRATATVPDGAVAVEGSTVSVRLDAVEAAAGRVQLSVVAAP